MALLSDIVHTSDQHAPSSSWSMFTERAALPISSQVSRHQLEEELCRKLTPRASSLARRPKS